MFKMGLSKKQLLLLAVIVIAPGLTSYRADARDLKITLPKRSQLTPVQRLNREGVDAIRKQQYEKAITLFYKAYLLDPDDPFTLYDLGYVSELQGQFGRAQRFYALASQQATNAIIDRANSSLLEGKSMKDAFSDLRDVPMQVNRANVESIHLLSEGRAPEAELLLQKTLALDQRNAFTLNNMGVAKEAEGDLDGALKYYLAAANLRSSEPVIVTVDGKWRGKPVSEMAADSARKIRERMQTLESPQTRAAMLNLRGVSAINRNDWHHAAEDFRQAYSLDPYSAFSLNNVGFLAEMDGDLETAEFFYEKAHNAEGANAHVGLASRRSAEGMSLFQVADDSDQKVEAQIVQDQEVRRRRQSGPIRLKRRDGKPVDEPQQPAPPPILELPPETPQPQAPPIPPAGSPRHD